MMAFDNKKIISGFINNYFLLRLVVETRGEVQKLEEKVVYIERQLPLLFRIHYG